MTKTPAIALIAAVLLASIGTADAQQAADPRVADLVQAGKVRVGLFSTQYTKDPISGELRSVRVDIAQALAAASECQQSCWNIDHLRRSWNVSRRARAT